MTEGKFTGLKIPDLQAIPAVIDVSGLRALESVVNYIRYLENENEKLHEQNVFLEDERRRCYLDMEKDEEKIERLKCSNIYLTQCVIDLYKQSQQSSLIRRKQGRKWKAR